jgi:hypothetical protein
MAPESRSKERDRRRLERQQNERGESNHGSKGTKRGDVYGIDWNESWIMNVWEMKESQKQRRRRGRGDLGVGESLAERKGASQGRRARGQGAPGDAMDRVQLYLYTRTKNDATVLRLGHARVPPELCLDGTWSYRFPCKSGHFSTRSMAKTGKGARSDHDRQYR